MKMHRFGFFIKKSIRNEILFIFVVILTATVGLCWIINTFFLERIYISQKENAVISVYDSICYDIINDNLTSSEFDEKIERLSLTNDVSIAIMTSFFKPLKVYSNEPEERIISEMINNLSGRGYYDEVIDKTSEYILIFKTDPRTELESIEMWGNLPDGSIFLLRTNLESVHQSAKLASRVLLLVGICSIFIGSILVFLFTRRITRPILGLSELAGKMSEMDFNSKYTGNDYNEIGVLGIRMNKMSENLENAISQLKIANIELTKDIEARDENDRLRKDFVANVSHELKTPISLIQGYAEGLKDGVNDEADREYYCDVIIDESDKMSKMVSQLINLNQLESGIADVHVERFNLTELIRNFVQKTELIFKQEDISVSVPEENVYVWADEFMMEEVLMNYISNAIHHCESDCLKRIDVSYKKEENRIRVNVFNTGKGIPEEAIGRIWDKFYKVDKARTRKYGGSGIGLSIVKAIAEAHGQECGAFNSDDGVNFWFTIDSSDK